MSKMTYEKLMEYNSIAGVWLKKEPSNQNTKLGYAISVFSKKYNKYLIPYNDIVNDRNERIDDAKVTYASEDEDKNLLKLIVKDDKGQVTYTEYKYTKENQNLFNKKVIIINKEANLKIEDFLCQEIEIEPYYATSLPNNLTEIERAAFTGIVINPSAVMEVSQNGKVEKELAS